MHTRTILSLAGAVLFAAGAHAAQPSTPDLIIAPTAKGADKLSVSFDDKHVWIDSGNTHLQSQVSKGSRWYRTAKGDLVAELKDDSLQFKLRDEAGKLLWKVKFDGDKIKIADNEDMQKAWSIKHAADHDKVYDPKGTELGTIRTGSESGKTKVKDAKDKEQYVVELGRPTAAPGVLLMKGIPEAQRDIIAAELLIHMK